MSHVTNSNYSCHGTPNSASPISLSSLCRAQKSSGLEMIEWSIREDGGRVTTEGAEGEGNEVVGCKVAAAAAEAVAVALAGANAGCVFSRGTERTALRRLTSASERRRCIR
mmetsp:Transcript_82052/g.120287  ORF Transcript_82052/g.120287 Transcript_82052/m.120287 type:complete len:111 (-) Transcript_82052:695-1027(-)